MRYLFFIALLCSCQKGAFVNYSNRPLGGLRDEPRVDTVSTLITCRFSGYNYSYVLEQDVSNILSYSDTTGWYTLVGKDAEDNILTLSFLPSQDTSILDSSQYFFSFQTKYSYQFIYNFSKYRLALALIEKKERITFYDKPGLKVTGTITVPVRRLTSQPWEGWAEITLQNVIVL